MSLIKIENLDTVATRNAVHKFINEYHQLLHLSPLREEPSVTQSFSFIPPTTNRSLNNVEQAASRNIKRQELMERREETMAKMHEAVECLKPNERYIIVYKYLQEEKMMDVELYTELGISRTKYYELKNDAIVRLAFFLGLEVYGKGEGET
ncbi:ArpU family phage packaging/lysis transcriptional regulator [Salinicoccus bachuensis]|uniref:ArpU family phage packaging/lysis transcriptional regulator n=1 Tax=Salinicoccus bachuensis TaxID=3136731 RepID=A0ABZ3CGQ1_9STAP